MQRSPRTRVWSQIVFLSGMGCSPAFAQDAPPLLPPELVAPSADPKPSEGPAAATPSTTKPVSPKPAVAPRPTESRPLLLIPGVTAPGSRPVPSTSSLGSAGTQAKPEAMSLEPPLSLDSTSDGDPPALDPGPGTLAPPRRVGNGRSPATAAATASPNGRASSIAPRFNIPLSLEPIPDDPGSSDSDPRPPSNLNNKPSPLPDDSSAIPMTPLPESNRPTNRGPSPSESRRASAPGTGAGMFGRIFDPSRLDPSRSQPRSEVKVERRSDPATDAALKRRVEHQIREQLGDKVNSVDVRVAGKNVLIRAHATRFWQKRAVRRSLETLPAVASLQTRVEID